MLGLIAMFLAGLFFSSFFSMLEAAIISQDRHRLLHMAEEGDPRAIIMRRLLTRIDRLLSTLLLCNNLANVSCAAAATALAADLLAQHETGLVIVTLIVTFLLLVFSEITPKVIGVRHALVIALGTARLLQILQKTLTPFTAVANFCANTLLALLGHKKDGTWQTVMSLKELRSAVRSAIQTADSGTEHFRMVEKTLRLGELTIDKIMTPRHEITAINLKDSPKKIAAALKNTSHTKLPVFDGDLESPYGIIDTLSAVKLAHRGPPTSAAIKKACEKIDFAPATLTALQQLKNMQHHKQRVSLVVDGGGRVAGILTFTDFAQAIIGDESPPHIPRGPLGEWLLRGDTPLLQMEQLQPGAAIPSDTNASTVNGMLLDYLGDVPPRPACVRINDWYIEIRKMDDKAIQEIALLPSPPDKK